MCFIGASILAALLVVASCKNDIAAEVSKLVTFLRWQATKIHRLIGGGFADGVNFASNARKRAIKLAQTTSIGSNLVSEEVAFPIQYRPFVPLPA